MTTILSQLPLPTSIQKYPPEDQEIITEFLTVLQHFEVNTSEKRETLLELMNSYNDKYYPNHEDYIRLPFLWFAIDYFNIARRILNAAGFYPARFYKYLVQHFRNNAQTQGIFDLIRTTTPLIDLKWEKIQYSCNRFTIPLTDEEIQALEAVYSYVSSTGVRALNRKRLKAAIASTVRKPQFIRSLAQLFVLLNAQWNIRFYPPAFGLEQLFFQFKLNESTSLTEILDLQNPANTTLGASFVYRIDESQDYLGIMWLPTNTINAMQDYLIQKEKQDILVLNGLARIKDTQVSSSLTLYEPRKGWRGLNASEYRRLKQQLKPSITRRARSKPSPFYLSSPFNKKWHYQKDNNSETSIIVKLLCKFSRSFQFDNLPFSRQLENRNIPFSDYELQLLTDLLHNNQVIQVNFDPIRLFQDFSPDQYWASIPCTAIPFEKISFLLSMLPTANIFTTKEVIHVWTVLTSSIAQFLIQEIGLSVHKIVPYYWGRTIKPEWFNPQTNEWKIPKILILNP